MRSGAFSGRAPAGAAFVRVNLKFLGRDLIDNVVLKIDGVDVSEINGGSGMPIRPQDYLRNAGDEAGIAEWRTGYWSFYASSDAFTYVEDPLKLGGTKAFSSGPYDKVGYFQQVWLSASELPRDESRLAAARSQRRPRGLSCRGGRPPVPR